ncbi:glycosyltransferase [Nostoc sp.]
MPYVIISQKASDSVCPHGKKRQMMQDMYRQAKASFFVYQHNLSLTEAQIGYSLANAEVVRNPHRVIIPEPLPYPKIEDEIFKIACVARLWILDKGQDVLLRVLAQDKWQHRHLHIYFFGTGVDRDTLIDMANFLGLKNVSFPGFVENIVDIWHHHHALIMPSRAEGLPIALVEAMMCGRPGIVTDVGGVSEVVEDDITGFMATGASFQEIDKVLERAWQRRYEWENIGKEASIFIRQLIPSYPERIFADKLVQLSTLELNPQILGDRK